jgi:sulfotransferase famil protein
MRPVTRAFRRYSAPIADTACHLLFPQAHAFYTRLMEDGYQPHVLVDVLSDERIIYVCVPKCASSRIKKTLGALLGRCIRSSEEAYERKQSGLKNPKSVGISTFHRVATDPRTLRFSFVRNPYARLVSLWAHQFQNRPLVPGLSSIDTYLAWRGTIDPRLPRGADSRLSFDQFVAFATATADYRVDAHWTHQHIIADMPGIALDLIGKVETFAHDFSAVLDHVHAGPELRVQSMQPFNASDHDAWPSFYTTELADIVYRAYEPDFDRFKYPRKLAH